MALTYNKERDLSPVIEEPVLSISHVLETGVIPSGGVDDDSFGICFIENVFLML